MYVRQRGLWSESSHGRSRKGGLTMLRILSDSRLVLATLAIPALLLASCATSPSATGGAPIERTISMAAVEPKGGVTADQEPFPTQPLPDGGGYILKAPDASGRWEVSTYRWDPGTIVVNQGERVTLEMVGINGKEHPFRIEGYNLGGVVRRGQVTRTTFTAAQAGVFQIMCDVHLPTMHANLIVLPTSR